MLEDLCFAISLLARHPGVMAEAIVALALGIGANITAVTLVDALLMRNPVTRVSITLVLAAVSMTASALPARWATRVDPMAALRDEVRGAAYSQLPVRRASTIIVIGPCGVVDIIVPT